LVARWAESWVVQSADSKVEEGVEWVEKRAGPKVDSKVVLKVDSKVAHLVAL
jgi:hypothetical protein